MKHSRPPREAYQILKMEHFIQQTPLTWGDRLNISFKRAVNKIDGKTGQRG
ncbi:MAG: hypothetical protein RQ982_01900 [Gammaproteobacteria bacterium]|nr:hypothetical protein [Gammaproteobacteria bacterium]